MANQRAGYRNPPHSERPPVHFSTVGRISIYFLNCPDPREWQYSPLRVDDGGESEDSPHRLIPAPPLLNSNEPIYVYTNPHSYPYVVYYKDRRDLAFEPDTTEYILPEDHPAARGLHRNPGPLPGLFQARPNPLELTNEEKYPLLRYQPFATPLDPYGINNPEARPFIYPDPNVVQKQNFLNLQAQSYIPSGILSTGLIPPSSAPGFASPGFEQIGPLTSAPRVPQTSLQTSDALNQAQRSLAAPESSNTGRPFVNETLNRSHVPYIPRPTKLAKRQKQRPKPRARIAPSKLSREVILSPESQNSSFPQDLSTSLAPELSAAGKPAPAAGFGNYNRRVEEELFPPEIYNNQDFVRNLFSSHYSALPESTHVANEFGELGTATKWHVYSPKNPAFNLPQTALGDPNLVKKSLNPAFFAPWELPTPTTKESDPAKSAPTGYHQMPYNNSAIPPTEETTGTATLPLARVKKILAIDEDISAVSANASFAITIATEMFIRYFAEQAMNVFKSERKPRRNIQYKDLANAVSRIDNLSFLEDIVPKTSTYREYKSRRARSAQESAPLQNGQTTLDAPRPLAQRPISQGSFPLPPPNPIADRVALATTTIDEHAAQRSPSQPHMPNGQQLIFEHYEPNGNVRRDESGDVEMN